MNTPQTYTMTEKRIPFADGGWIYGKLYLPADAVKPPLCIFSHELGTDHTAGIPYAEALTGVGYATFVYDFRGGSREANASSGRTVDMSVLTEERDLAAVIEASLTWEEIDPDPSKRVLIGASQGGVVTAIHLAEHPEDAAARILLYPALVIPGDCRELFPVKEEIPESFPMWGGWITLGGGYARDAWDIDIFETIRAYHGPQMLIYGTADAIVDPSYPERVAVENPDMEVHVIEGGRHMFKKEALTEALGYVTDFVKRV